MRKSCLFIVFCLLPAWVDAESYRTQTVSVGDSSWQLTIPTGYQLELLVEISKPRMLAFADDSALLVGSHTGDVYRVPPPYDRATVFATLQRGNAHGVAVRTGSVWVASQSGVYRIPYRPRSSPYTPEDFQRIADLPSKNGGHSSRTIKVGPDNGIYVSLGISGNCSDEYIGAGYDFENRRGGVLVLRENAAAQDSPSDTKDTRIARWHIYASGLRNPVGFDWHPRSGVMYASNHGPDHLGYDHPAEYFSRILPGSFHGMPWFWFDGEKVQRDRCIGRTPPRTDAVLPSVTFPARNAPMGVAFVPQDALGRMWEHDAIVALHGSWATQPAGGFFGAEATRRPPWIAVVHFDQGEALRVAPLIKGFQNTAGKRLARPTGLAFGTDGALYFTSDGGAVEGLFRFKRAGPHSR